MKDLSPKPLGFYAARDYFWVVIAVILIAVFTRPYTLGDTHVYTRDIVACNGRSPLGVASPIWEFGHLLWRPLGWALLKLVGGVAVPAAGGNVRLVSALILIALNYLAGAIAVLFWHSLVRTICRSRFTAVGVSVAFACASAFLAYSKAGTSYVVGLMFLVVSLWLVKRAAQRDSRHRQFVLAGAVSLALAVLFWFPYVLALAGILTACLWESLARWDLKALLGARTLRCACWFLLMFGLCLAISFSLACAAAGVRSLPEAADWASGSGHGWSQSSNAVRLATGLPRSFLTLGRDGLLFKRYVNRDIYSPVTIAQLVQASLWKLVLFWMFVLALVYELWRRAEGPRAVLLLLAAGTAPVLVFAVFLFEPGSPERWFPIYPFLIVSVASALEDFPRKRTLSQFAIAAFLACMLVYNCWAAYPPRIESEDAPSRARAAALKPHLGPGDWAAVTTNQDSLYTYNGRTLFDPILQPDRLPLYDVIEPANLRVLTWREEFAARVLRTWDGEGSVWLTKRFWAVIPQRDWNWAEGDDRRISWRDLPVFFRELKISQPVGGPDGFVCLDRVEANLKYLSSFAGNWKMTTSATGASSR